MHLLHKFMANKDICFSHLEYYAINLLDLMDPDVMVTSLSIKVPILQGLKIRCKMKTL